MILVSGGTGFIGSRLVQQLTTLGYPVRLLIRPSRTSPKIPKGIPVEISVSSLSDEKGIKAALKGISIVYHLCGVEQQGYRADLMQVEVGGTTMLAQMAADAKVDRFFYLSHIGADRASAYPLMKAKGIAEHAIKNAGVPFTILRSALIFGENDHFTTRLARLIKLAPGILLMPGDGNSLLQPLWVEDLITSLIWSMDLHQTCNQVIEIGGQEYLSFKEILKTIMEMMGKKKALQEFNPVYLRWLTELFEIFSKRFSTTVFWIDYLAENRICSLDSLPNIFNIAPARFSQKIIYLQKKKK